MKPGCTERSALRRGALLGQQPFQSLAVASEIAKRITEPGRPVGACNDPTLRRRIEAPAKNHLDDGGQPFSGLADDALVAEGLLVDAGQQAPGEQVIAADHPEILRLDLAGVTLHRFQESRHRGRRFAIPEETR